MHADIAPAHSRSWAPDPYTSHILRVELPVCLLAALSLAHAAWLSASCIAGGPEGLVSRLEGAQEPQTRFYALCTAVLKNGGWARENPLQHTHYTKTSMDDRTPPLRLLCSDELGQLKGELASCLPKQPDSG
jgi:hypothetical protein